MVSTQNKKTLLAGGVAAAVTAAAVVLSPISSVSPFKSECPEGQAMAPHGNVQLTVCWATPTTPSAPPPSPGCDRNATPQTLGTQIATTADGQTLCLAAGDYGTFQGTNRAITIKSATGQTASMAVNIGPGDSGFTLKSLTIGRTDIADGATDITFRDSTFVGKAFVRVANANILFDHNTHNNMDGGSACAGCEPARVQVMDVPGGDPAAPSGVTVRNSFFSGGDADGLWTSQGAVFEDNEFLDICLGTTGNHTDSMQIGVNAQATGIVFRRNFIHQTSPPCDGQAMSAFDEVKGATIVDNVVNHDIRPWGIEVFSDDTSTIAHNTVVGNPGNVPLCNFSTTCGWIELNAKATDDPGFGTIVKDNSAYRIVFNGLASAGEQHHNMVVTATGKAPGDFVGTPVFVGGANPSTYAGYCLAPGSPGKNAASDGLDVGIRC